MFYEKVKELYEKLEKKGNIVVATSSNDYVTTRTLSTIFYHSKIYFQTNKNFLTVKQLEKT